MILNEFQKLLIYLKEEVKLNPSHNILQRYLIEWTILLNIISVFYFTWIFNLEKIK